MSKAEDLLAIHLKELHIEFEREYRFYPERKWRLDFYMPVYKVGIEVEGGIWSHGRHTRGRGFQNDTEKYNYATMQGIRVFRFTTEQVLTGQAKELLRTWLKEKAA